MAKTKVTKVVTDKPGLLPKMTAEQRAKLKIAKTKKSLGKTIAYEAGKTARSIVSNIAANRTAQAKIAADAMKNVKDTSNVDNAISLYEQIIQGNPDSQGKSGSESTTQVGGSGSKLGG